MRRRSLPTPTRPAHAHTVGGGSRALAVLSVAFFMVILDTTIVNVALPSIQTGLRGTVTNLQWVVDGFTLALASVLLAAGSMADRHGARRLFRIGLILFTAGSACSAVAPTLGLLVAARILQGLGAALILPTSLALMAVTFPHPPDRARALGIWAAAAGIATAMGPLVGGALVALAGWRTIFLVNVPIGVGAWVLARRWLTEAPTRRTPLDWPGQVLGASALTLVTGALVEAGAMAWTSGRVFGLGILGLVLGLLFLGWERRVPYPLLPRRLFANPVFSTANGVGWVLNFGIYGPVFVLSLYFQQHRGFNALATGCALLPFALMTVVGPVVVGRLIARVGPQWPMVMGQGLAAGGTAALAFAGVSTPYLRLVPGLVALGVGMALTMPALTAAAVQAAPMDLAGVASGFLNTARQIGGALGVAVLGSLVAHHFMEGWPVALGMVAALFVLGGLAAARYGAAPTTPIAPPSEAHRT